MDPETYELFRLSSFDAYYTERFTPVLREGVRVHGLQLSDVLAITQDIDLWAACRTGVFKAGLKGMVKKRIEVDRFINYSEVAAIFEKPSGPHTMRIVLQGNDSRDLARIDFLAGGMDNTPEIAARHRRYFLGVLQDAWNRARQP